MNLGPKKIKSFQKKILAHYRSHGRRLPFRETKNPYFITVSEIMLQQTQVDRVIPFYNRWIKLFPTWKALSNASTKKVLSAWSGLGYNRRALNLQKLAHAIVNRFGGIFPTDETTLLSLPGIGPYTANAICIFAFNADRATIDTNIRRVLIHELGLRPDTSMKQLQSIAQRVLPKNKSRDWHNALMDFGAMALPKTPQIKPLSRQSAFKGSLRQIRGEIIRQLTTKRVITLSGVARLLERSVQDVRQAALALEKEGLVRVSKHQVRIAAE